MRWQDLRRSGNVEDRRGSRAPLAVGGGVGAVVLALLVMLLGGDPGTVLNSGTGAGPAAGEPPPPPGADPASDFVTAVMGDTEDTWSRLYPQLGRGSYAEPRLVLFTDAVQSACGFAQAASGPFYCPPDERVYIDLGFYRDLEERLGAGGDFAQAYVIAHEVGHHVQHLLGISDQVHAQKQRLSQSEGNALSVRLELQADCFAGVWGNSAQRRGVLEPGDVEEAMNAAAAIGDDRLQRAAQGRVVPESFTHGTSEQRARWFRRGLESGDPGACDTFGAARL